MTEVLLEFRAMLDLLKRTRVFYHYFLKMLLRGSKVSSILSEVLILNCEMCGYSVVFMPFVRVIVASWLVDLYDFGEIIG